MKKLILFSFIATLIFFSCTLFKKDIRKPVKLYFNEDEITATISSSAYYTKYIELLSPDDVRSAFLEHFKSEGNSTDNLILTNDINNADFVLKFKSLQLSESSKTEKVSDPKSQYNGQDIILNSVECFAAFEIISTKYPSQKFLTCTNSKSRSEKFTNDRDLGDLITGSNKDKSEYRTKLLRDGIALQLAQDVGRRIWVPITRRIAKTQK